MATDLLEMLTVPEGFGSAANAANETRQPNAISHVANNFFVITVLPWTGNPLYYRFVLQVCPNLRLWWRRYKHRVELSDTRRDKPPSASQSTPIQRQPNRPLVHRRGHQGAARVYWVRSRTALPPGRSRPPRCRCRRGSRTTSARIRQLQPDPMVDPQDRTTNTQARVICLSVLPLTAPA